MAGMDDYSEEDDDEEDEDDDEPPTLRAITAGGKVRRLRAYWSVVCETERVKALSILSTAYCTSRKTCLQYYSDRAEDAVHNALANCRCSG